MKNKNLIIVLITILSIICIALIVFMINLLNRNIKFSGFNFFRNVSNELVVDETYDNQFNKISISTTDGDIYVKSTDDTTVRVVVYGDKDKTKVQTNGSELSIKSESKKCNGFCFNITIDKIEVYLPSDFANEIIINNSYGDINIDSFLNANIDVNEDCGDVSILGGNKIKVENNYGDIEIKQANEVDINASAGDVTIGDVNDVNVENNYGDIYIKKVSNYLNVTDDCGDIEINNVFINKNSTVVNNYGDIKIGATNDIYIDAKVDLGDIKINNNTRQSDITLKVQNDCGDITVNN